jgi:hypothetical protein
MTIQAKFRSTVFCLTTVVLLAGIAQASGPIGVYALVDKVTFEPSAEKPERIKISGVFITAEDTPDNSTVYASPQRGYLYFELPARNAELARREWSDLQSLAGSRQVVGFGSSWGTKAHVKKSAEEAKSPEEYPAGNGLVKVNADQPRAKALLDYKGN